MADLARFATFLVETNPSGALVVGSRGKHGYIALYRFEEMHDVVRVLALRHQREAGYLEE